MMVGELINILKQYNPYLPVCIGEIQSFRSNFAIEIDNIDVFKVDDWEYWEEHKVVLTQGSKIGTINYRK